MKKEIIEIIKNCPSCDTELERVNDQLFCRNQSCSSKVVKQIEKFCKVLKLKGFGPKTIEKLEVTTISDLFSLTEDEYVKKLGLATGSKLFSMVGNLKEVPLDKFLAAVSIPGVGETTASKIAGVVTTFKDIDEEHPKLREVLGQKTAEKVANWYKQNSSLLNSIDLKITNVVKDMDVGFKVCVTGKVQGHTRTSIKEDLARYGVTMTTTVTKDLDYLVCDDTTANSSKLIKARQNDIKIITYEQLKEILNG
jgi:NAD-dependent DNA ligase